MPDPPEAFAAAGIPAGTPKPAVYDYQRRQRLHVDELVAELDTPDWGLGAIRPELNDKPPPQVRQACEGAWVGGWGRHDATRLAYL